MEIPAGLPPRRDGMSAVRRGTARPRKGVGRTVLEARYGKFPIRLGLHRDGGGQEEEQEDEAKKARY